MLVGNMLCSLHASAHTNSAVRFPEVVVEERGDPEAASLQDSPVTVSPLTSEEILAADIRSLDDLPAHVPNLGISANSLRSFGDTYGIRGLVNTPFFSDPAVALYVDDVPYGNAFSFSTELFEIERIDVFRGPQGHRYGKNASAGVINVATRQPRDRYDVNATVGFGSYDFQHHQASLMGPILTNFLYFGIAGLHSKRDGFLRNTTLKTEPDTQDALNGRLFLTWTPATDWDITCGVSAEDYDDGVQRFVPLSGDHFKNASDFDGVTEIAANSQWLRVRYDGPGVAFTSVTARRDWNLDPFTLDLDLSPFVGNTALIKQDQKQWTQELRFQSPAGVGDWKWLGGFFFSTSEIEGDSERNFLVFPPSVFANERTRFTLGDDDYALFGEATFSATDKFNISLGSRFDYTVKRIDRTKASTLGAVAPLHKEREFFNAAPKLTLDYRCTESVMVYGSTGLGFKPGGFSGFIDPPASAAFDTELTWANEIGVKSMWLDKRISANVVLFYYDIQDYQVEKVVPATTFLTIVNAPEATSMGAELELRAMPLEGLQLSTVFGYTHIEFDRFKSNGINVEGKRAPFTPEFNLGLAAEYKHRCGFLSRIEFDVVGETFYDEFNAARGRQSSYGLLHAKIGYERKHFGIYAYGHNLTDKEYFTNKRLDLNAGVPGEPLTGGVMATLKY